MTVAERLSGLYVPRPSAETAFELMRRIAVTDPALYPLMVWLLQRFDPLADNISKVIHEAARSAQRAHDLDRWLPAAITILRPRLTRFEAKSLENLLTKKAACG
jgi:hypothetical protein